MSGSFINHQGRKKIKCVVTFATHKSFFTLFALIHHSDKCGHLKKLLIMLKCRLVPGPPLTILVPSLTLNLRVLCYNLSDYQGLTYLNSY